MKRPLQLTAAILFTLATTVEIFAWIVSRHDPFDATLPTLSSGNSYFRGNLYRGSLNLYLTRMSVPSPPSNFIDTFPDAIHKFASFEYSTAPLFGLYRPSAPTRAATINISSSIVGWTHNLHIPQWPIALTLALPALYFFHRYRKNTPSHQNAFEVLPPSHLKS